jgi:Calx-beta domain-containing protein/parallel beta helix pectate lyase-like protein
MSSSPFLRAHTRVHLIVLFCVTLAGFASVWPSSQKAKAPSRVARSNVLPISSLPDKGVITPEATISVNSLLDLANSTDGLCTLREAIAAANNDVASGVVAGECAAGSSSGSDSIDASGITGTINLTGALPDLVTSMTIVGPGSGQLMVRRDTGGSYRIFNTGTGPITITGLTVSNGTTVSLNPSINVSTEDGGGIRNGGMLTLVEVTISGNSTGSITSTTSSGITGKGGGIYNTGTLTMTNCTVSGNKTGDAGPFTQGSNPSGSGGGIHNAGSLTMTDCLVDANMTGAGGLTIFSSSGYGAGIFTTPATALTLTRVTISNNAVGTSAMPAPMGDGGGLYSQSDATLTYCTIRGNQTGRTNGTGGLVNQGNMTIANSVINANSSSRAAILNLDRLIINNSTISGNHSSGIVNDGGPGSLRLNNCTVAQNDLVGVDSQNPNVARIRNTIVASNNGAGLDLSGAGFITLGHNLIGRSDGTNGLVNGSNGDLVGTTGSPIDAQLGPLANNGSPTMTHALLSTSLALDAGDNCVTEPTVCGDPNILPYTTDQRGAGFNRMVDGPDADAIATVDIGACETQVALADLPDTSTNEDTQLLIYFDGGDTSTITSMTATSSDAILVPNDSAHLSVVLTGSTGALTITPAANLSGTTNITVTINRTGGPDSKTFLLTVNPVNDVPSFTKGADQTVNEDAGAQTVNNWATAISPGPAGESGQTLTFQVTGNSNAGLFSAGPAVDSSGTLTYTPAANANGSATITINLKDNGGTANGGVDTSASQTLTIAVNSVNDVPSFTKGADQVVNEDAGAQTVNNWATAISAGAADEAGQTLTFQVTGNTNAALFSSGPAISSAGTLTYTPAANANGSATLTINLKDNGGAANGGVDTSASQTFNITVNAVNDAPSFNKGADQTVNEDAGAQTVAWATSISPGPADESSQTVTFQITGNTNGGLFSSGPAVSSSGILTYTPAANANGSATITINLKDNGGTANGGVDTSADQTFTIAVNAVNDAPSFTIGAGQTVNEDSGAQSVPNWATAISRGPADESAQTLTFQVTGNTNAGLFSAGPAISSTGTLTYTPAANAHGSATITVNLKDNGGTANGGVDTSLSQTFTITVNAVNDVPSFTKGADQTVNEDAGAQGRAGWATFISFGPANEVGQVLTFQVTGNTNAALFSAGPAVSAAGTLTYTPAADASGSATITINLKDDGGTTNGGVDTSASQTFNITVNSVNDAPSFIKGANQTVSNNAGAQTINNWATAISPGPTNESGQSVAFQVTTNNVPLFSVLPAISPNGTLTFTPNPNNGGTAQVFVILKDNGGTVNGGVDTSASQSFIITVNPVGGFFSFSQVGFATNENSGSTSITVRRTGDTSRAATVDYATSGHNGLPCSTANGVATPKCDFTDSFGTLSFAAGDTTKAITLLIGQDSFVEGQEEFTVELSNATGGAALGSTSSTTIFIIDDNSEPPANVIDDVRNFVRQHYHDFLNREPDTSGWDFWTNQITSCGSDVQCNEVRRIDVSASFFLSIEFQQSGYLVERFYKTGYGDAVGTSTFVSNHQLNVPIVRFSEFLKDTQRIGQGVIVLAPGWEQVLENNKQAYALEFVQTTRFTTALPTTMTPAQFVDRLNQNTGGVLNLTERQTAIDLFGGAANTTNVNARAQAVRMVADDTDLFSAEYNRAFVLTQYFGYLRRNPNDAPEPTLDYTGYDFWLTKLNQFNGNYINAEMVKAFLSSIEYRQRFGP